MIPLFIYVPLAEIQKNSSPVRVLLLTVHDEPAYLRTALAAGASGYVLKKSVDADLLSAIRSIHKGRTYVDSELASEFIRQVLPEHIRDRNDLHKTYVLSERETQVLKLVAEGFSSREVAEQIYVSTKTVETYRRRFVEKLGLESRADIVRYALDLGVLSPEKFTSPKNERGSSSPVTRANPEATHRVEPTRRRDQMRTEQQNPPALRGSAKNRR